MAKKPRPVGRSVGYATTARRSARSSQQTPPRFLNSVDPMASASNFILSRRFTMFIPATTTSTFGSANQIAAWLRNYDVMCC